MANNGKNKSTKNAEKRRIVQIDITDIYERLKRKSNEEIRSVEEQCKFFIKKGLDSDFIIPSITYVQQPLIRERDNWDRNQAPTPTYPYNPSWPSYVYCNTNEYCNTNGSLSDAVNDISMSTSTLDAKSRIDDCVTTINAGGNSLNKTN